MKDEIKEILDNLIRYRYSDYECKQPEDCLTIEDVWLLLDYITNLQEENERLKKDYYEEYDTHLKDKTYYFNLFEDYKARNEKAVDLIIGKIDYDDEYPGYMQMLEVDYNDLLETLQGKSDE